MKIGFISGDLMEVNNERAGVSVPDYPVQGYLMRRLIERGHEVVLLTRYPQGGEPPEGVVSDVNGDPMDHGLDVLFGDRLGRFGSEWEDHTRLQIERYEGSIVFHQYIAHTGWAPPFRDEPHLLGYQRDWTIMNRSPRPRDAYHAMVGFHEKIRAPMGVRWETWKPFLMWDYPWNGTYTRADEVIEREYAQGYYGRVPQQEKRARGVTKWLGGGLWPRVVYGPTTSTKWVSETTGAADGGRVLHRDLPEALSTFNVIVQCPIDRLRNKSNIDYWPHRIVECALAGVFQLFDPEFGLREFARWRLRTTSDLTAWMRRVLDDVDALRDEIQMQQAIILPHADPTACMDRLEEILKGATR